MSGPDYLAEEALDAQLRPHAVTDSHEVHQQLEKILASRFFVSSKRYSGLLKYLVECGSGEKADVLKERTIGVDVFGRPADYDCNTDHVVRTAVGEIRKRLAQYYLQSDREGELRIEVPPGTYRPRFRANSGSRAINPGNPATDPDALPSATSSAIVPLTQKYRWFLAAAIAFSAVVLTATIGFEVSSHRANAVDRFWAPLTSSDRPILLCVGDLSRAIRSSNADSTAYSPPDSWTLRDYTRQHAPLLAGGDAVALAHLAGAIQPRHQNLRILTQSDTTLDDLRGIPAVLIGVGSNDWTSRLTGKERFTTVRPRPTVMSIRDRENPERNDWYVDYGSPYLQLSRDYAIVSRIRNPITEQIVVLVGGLYSYGNIGAAEFLSNPDYLRNLERIAPPGWESKNLEFVLSVDVIKGKSGVPRIVASHFW